jgi:hypothetical protein
MTRLFILSVACKSNLNRNSERIPRSLLQGNLQFESFLIGAGRVRQPAFLKLQIFAILGKKR